MAVMRVPKEFVFSRNAGTDLSSKLHFLAKLNSDGEFVLAGDGDHAVGNIIEAAASGAPVTVQFGGIGKVELGGTVAAGERIASDSNGNAVVATSGKAVIGIAVEGGADGDVIPFIHTQGQVA